MEPYILARSGVVGAWEPLWGPAGVQRGMYPHMLPKVRLERGFLIKHQGFRGAMGHVEQAFVGVHRHFRVGHRVGYPKCARAFVRSSVHGTGGTVCVIDRTTSYAWYAHSYARWM